MSVAGIIAVKTFTLPPQISSDDGNPVVKRALLVLLCLVFGVELGYKICSMQVLYLLNLCHVVTMAEVGVVQGFLSVWDVNLLVCTEHRFIF